MFMRLQSIVYQSTVSVVLGEDERKIKELGRNEKDIYTGCTGMRPANLAAKNTGLKFPQAGSISQDPDPVRGAAG